MLVPPTDEGFPELIDALEIPAGRFETWYANFPAANMPTCWTGSADDYRTLDAHIEKGPSAGLDPGASELQLVYIPPCALMNGANGDTIPETTGIEDLRPSRLAYPSFYTPAVHTNPAAVESVLYDLIKHAATTWGIRTFGVWNEPDGIFPMDPLTYLGYYTLSNRALRRVEDETGLELRIGGPTSSFDNAVLIETLLDHVIRNELTSMR